MSKKYEEILKALPNKTLDTYPKFDKSDQAEEYIKNLVNKYNFMEIRDFDTEWNLDDLKKDFVDQFENAYKNVREDKVSKLDERSEKLELVSLNSLSLGIIIGGLTGYFTGDMTEGIRTGGLTGGGVSLALSYYSTYLGKQKLNYKDRLKEVHYKFVKEPLHKLYGLK